MLCIYMVIYIHFMIWYLRYYIHNFNVLSCLLKVRVKSHNVSFHLLNMLAMGLSLLNLIALVSSMETTHAGVVST